MATPGKPREMSLEEAQKRWNGKRRISSTCQYEAAVNQAYEAFIQGVGQLRETAINVGIIKSPNIGCNRCQGRISNQ